MKFFEYKDFKLYLNTPELLLIPEFKKLLDVDKSKDKSKAFKQFTYIYLMKDWKSPYIDFEESERHIESLKSSGLESTDGLEEALTKYEEILESDLTLVVIKSMKESIHSFKAYFKGINFTEKVESGPRKGSLVYSVSDYMRTMKEADSIFDTIAKLEEILKKKLKEDVSKRGNSEQPLMQY